MNEQPDVAAAQAKKTRLWICAILIGLLALAFNLYAGFFLIPKFRHIFMDMMGDKPLPTLTILVVNGQWAFLAVGCAFLIVAACIPRNRRAGAYLSLLVLALGLEMMVLVIGLMKPLIEVIKQLSGPS